MTVSDGQPTGVPVPGPPAGRPGPVPPRSDAPAGSDAARAAAPITDRIAAAARSLDDISELPLADHADLYQRAHAELQSALAEIDGA